MTPYKSITLLSQVQLKASQKMLLLRTQYIFIFQFSIDFTWCWSVGVVVRDDDDRLNGVFLWATSQRRLNRRLKMSKRKKFILKFDAQLSRIFSSC